MNFDIKRLRHTQQYLLTALIAFTLSACSSTDPEVERKMSSNKIRNAAIMDTAIRYGAQSGLAWQAKLISEEIKDYAPQVEQIYNFSALMMPDQVLPPVVLQSHNNLQLDNNDTIRTAQWVVKIEKPARFVTVPPTYRDYLTMNFKPPELPDPTLQPQNDKEWVIWNQYVQIGWNEGIQQGNRLFSQALSSMTEDLTGMALYHLLYTQNMISKPYVSSARLGITGNKNRMSIEDSILKITAHSGLKIKDSDHWKAAFNDEDGN